MKRNPSCWLFVALGVILTSTMAIAEYVDGTDQEDIDGPIMSPLLSEIILQNGQNFTLKCKGKRELQIKRQDIAEEPYGTFQMVDKKLNSTDLDYPFEVALDLFNVNQYTVGYYACFDDTVNSSAIMNNLMEEPSNTDHVTYTYIYVNETDVLFAPESEFFKVRRSKAILRCRPTMPDIKMTLSLVDDTHNLFEYEYEKYDPKIGITLDNDEFLEEYYLFECEASRRYDNTGDLRQVIIEKQEGSSTWTPPDLKIYRDNKYFLHGENFTLNCSVQYQLNSAIALSWEVPKTGGKAIITSSNELDVTPEHNLFNAITVLNATKDDEGFYTCILSGGHQKRATKATEKIFLSKPTIILKRGNKKIEAAVKKVQLMVEITIAYPPPTFRFYRDNVPLTTNTTKHKSYMLPLTGDLILSIFNCSVNDTANYTIEATSGNTTAAVTYDLRIKAAPIVDIGRQDEKILYQNSEISLSCEVTGYPLPTIEWIFSDDNGGISTMKGFEEKKSEFKVVSILNKTATNSGNVTCKALNNQGHDSASLRLLIYEIPDGFGVLDVETWYSENHKVSIRCIASKYKFSNSTWLSPDGEELEEYVKYSESSFSHVAKLKIDQVALSQAGTYTCMARYFNGSIEYENATVIVEAMREPIIYEPQEDRDVEVKIYQPLEFSCVADGVPVPTIEWFKDEAEVINNTNGVELYYHRNHTVVTSTIHLSGMNDTNKGKYECLATSEGIFKRRIINLVIVSETTTTLLSVIGAVILILIVLVLYLTWKIRKEKKFRKELAAAGLLYFKEGVTKSLNPDLGIDEQAELLPYNEKFEFSPDKLILGKQLGAGAFGVVYKADARGIINAEETTPVAVKMVKKTADNMYIKALASELKIMVHLGKHINIVNLLGACTKNVGKRELIVIVEYCKFGNIHNYMQKHREVFIDQLTDNKEKNLGKVNRGYSCSSASSGMNSDYFGTNHTQATDHTFVNTANTSRSGRKDKQNQQEEFVKVSETGYVQPEWRSNYESDYSFDGRNPRPLTSRDLLAWAFQIARGMEYLASRKVLHGDLAARNVLLAEDNIVKICDFGLARSIYKNDEYQKKENSLLPVKWLAIECMMDRIFSTQSDVWSFGIVLWEMFSLARTPYPNMSPQQLLQWLSDGHRLEKPSYADDRLYGIMKQCWEHKPNARPTFPQLQELLGSFLEDNVRNYYVDLNSAFSDLNVKCEGQEDYLAMVSAPDYNNLVTPSPHHYVNEVRSFFPPTPTQVPLDEEGYLQMTPMNPSIFSPRSQSTKFDFDAKKLDPRLNEGRGGSELTPMLTLNNLPARGGSDSDHEGHSPYLNMCPRIVEEIDDVFKPNHNNLKNIQNGAVTNPTYITLEVDVEKKPKDINNYINVPNGLVK